MAKGSIMKIVPDDDSATGYSAAIIIRNVNPRRKVDGSYYLYDDEFLSSTTMNVDGYKIKPRVYVRMWCPMSKLAANKIKKEEQRARAIAKSPMLF